jgi:signal transduction histidine kinase
MTGSEWVRSDSLRVAAGRGFAITSITLGGAGVILLAVFGGWTFVADSDGLMFGALAVMFGGLTWPLVRAQSRNGSVWAVAWGALFAALYTFGLGIAVVMTTRSLPLLTFAEFEQLSPSALPGVASAFVTARFWAIVPAFWLPLTLGLLLFPTGHAPSHRWNWVGWASIVAITTATVATAIVQNPWSTLPITSGEGTVPGFLGSLNDVGFALASLTAVLSVASLVVRYRGSAGVEQSQIRWIAFGGAVYVSALIIGGNLDGASPLVAIGGVLAASTLVVSYGISILKYRLYEIDVVVSKAVTFSVLAVFITGVYAVVVVGVGSWVGGGSDVVLSVVAVAVVAVLFEPVRVRVAHWANVLVYGERATPYEVLAGVTERLSESSDPDVVLGEVTRLVVEGTGASVVVVWLVVGGVLHPRASSPPEVVDGLEPVGLVEDVSSVVSGDRVVPIRYRGEVLGALSMVKGRGDSVSGADEKVLADVAAGAGVLVRNIGLNAELEERAEQLRVSRRRLVAAHDAERHRLERDLHDGAQQQVVALKVKLGIARTLAEREGADRVAGLVASLSETTQEAVDGMRAVAHGIYPPLLESDGLEAALGAARRTVPISVEIVTDGVGRYDRPVEENIYFAVLGVLTAAVDAGATRAIVELAGTDDRVGFTIDVDATPTDLTPIDDRINALDGTLTTTEAHESAVVVTAGLPRRACARVDA